MDAAGAAWVSAAIAFLALVAVIIFGVLNLRQARRGPAGSVRWALDRTGKSRVDLIQLGTVDARDVTVDIDAVRVNGDTTFTVFSSGQRASFIVATTMQSGPPKVRVQWADPDGARRNWESDVPGGG